MANGNRPTAHDPSPTDSFTEDVHRANPDSKTLREIADGLSGPSAFPPTVWFYRAAASYLRELAVKLDGHPHNGVDWGIIRASFHERVEAEHSDELLRRRS